jgi:hypothetical protein
LSLFLSDIGLSAVAISSILQNSYEYVDSAGESVEIQFPFPNKGCGGWQTAVGSRWIAMKREFVDKDYAVWESGLGLKARKL